MFELQVSTDWGEAEYLNLLNKAYVRINTGKTIVKGPPSGYKTLMDNPPKNVLDTLEITSKMQKEIEDSISPPKSSKKTTKKELKGVISPPTIEEATEADSLVGAICLLQGAISSY